MTRRLLPLSGDCREMIVADQSAALLVPQTECERLETGNERDGFDSLKERFGLVTSLQIVIWNSRTQMMNVMEADVS